jgi:putative inorganic carbon (hco3(-)) transporter
MRVAVVAKSKRTVAMKNHPVLLATELSIKTTGRLRVRDLFFLGYIGMLMLMAFRKPFLFMLLYAYLDIVSPQRMSYFLLNSVPLSLIVFALALLGFVVDSNKQDIRPTPRIFMLLLLLIWCGYTTLVAEEPVAAALKWGWVWKALVFAAFLPLTLRTKLRIEALVLTMVLCISTLIVVGGIKTLLGGGGYGVLKILVDNNSGLFESSTISMVAIAVIPFILWLTRYGTIFKPEWRVSAYAAALIGACLLIPIGTQARTGVICIAVLGLLMLRYARFRLLYLGGVVLLGLAAIPFLPSSFTKRTDTISNYQADESASTRIMVWKWTWEYVKQNPGGGGFDVYRKNRLRYEIPVAPQDIGVGGSSTKVIVDQGRAFHSSYFEMLGEQGFFGLFLWLCIHLGGVWRMEVVQRRYRKSDDPQDQWIAPLAIALQNSQIIYMVGSLFVGIAFQPFVYMFTGLQIGLDTYCSRRRQAAEYAPIMAARKKTG